jgi:hypothetical protein
MIILQLYFEKIKPTLQCNGKCHLMKELAKASANDDKPFSSDKKQSSNTLNDLLLKIYLVFFLV